MNGKKTVKELRHSDNAPRLLREIEKNVAVLKQIIARAADAIESNAEFDLMANTTQRTRASTAGKRSRNHDLESGN